MTDHFWSKIDDSAGPDKCWPWLDTKTKKGYGYILSAYRATTFLAHRQALILTTGENRLELGALHTCDNRACCNPSHLYWGTPKQNMDDCRQRNQKRKFLKLTAEQLNDIRKRYAAGERQWPLAREYRISQAIVSKIVRQEAFPNGSAPILKTTGSGCVRNRVSLMKSTTHQPTVNHCE